tara:strand:- start:420 stop:845 length:426 start_codon:yes stop_codon:yes gene_type:complete
LGGKILSDLDIKMKRDTYIRLLITSALLINLSSLALANDLQVKDSFLCVSQSGASAFDPNWDFKLLDTQEWRLLIKDKNTVTIGDDKSLMNGDLPIYSISPNKLVVYDSGGTFILSHKGRFTYAKATVTHAEMMTGVCKKI